jgi:uncharacterized protein (DUF608 family)
MSHTWNQEYSGENLNKVAFPLGGIGAGMVCLEGNGSLSHVSVRHRPEVFNQPFMFGAISVKEGDDWKARFLQGRIPDWKVMFPFGESSGNGGRNQNAGFPYFRDCRFQSEFPFATVKLADDDIPVKASLTGWSPFIPGQADDSSLPLAVLEYSFENATEEAVECVFTFASKHFMRSALEKSACCGGACEQPAPDHRFLRIENGFVLHQPQGGGPAHRQGDFAVVALEQARVNCQWFRGGWFDSQTMLWNQIANGQAPEAAPYRDGGPGDGASLAIPFTVQPGESRTIRLLMAWYVPFSHIVIGDLPEQPQPEDYYRPWYAQQFAGVEAVLATGRNELQRLRNQSQAYAERLAGCALPPEALEAVEANLTILKSPTVLRQHDGRLWAWEGCCDGWGCCDGSCTHVWNYAQALPHLFPELERSLRQTEFYENQDDRGHQTHRAWLPIRPTVHTDHAAADGQLGGIMKVHRDWQICGDDAWLAGLWQRVKQSMEYCIETWDPERAGLLVEPHHNTYDIEFWGPDGMCTSFYLGALKAAALMADVLGEDAGGYRALYEKGRRAMETELWNGEYFIQKIQTEGLKSPSPAEAKAVVGGNIYQSPEAKALLEKEGPKYQYGNGCLSDGVLGAWMAQVCGIGEILDPEKVKSHLLSVYKYNFRTSLHNHANPQRPTYALNDEGGLLLCTWPHGYRLSLPLVYSEEVWTGIEYQVASHLAMMGEREKCLEIVRAARQRYDGRVRNPYNEYECGHWYARAMSSYALLQAFGVKANCN